MFWYESSIDPSVISSFMSNRAHLHFFKDLFSVKIIDLGIFRKVYHIFLACGAEHGARGVTKARRDCTLAASVSHLLPVRIKRECSRAGGCNAIFSQTRNVSEASLPFIGVKFKIPFAP